MARRLRTRSHGIGRDLLKGAVAGAVATFVMRDRQHLGPRPLQHVRDVVGRFEEELRQAGCSVTVRGSDPRSGQWDRSRLDQVVTNLLSNAIKYGSGQPIEITLDGDERTARLEVRDHGIGILTDRLPHIFERFERAVSERHYGGLGLGLWIVRQIVDAFGGSVRALSAPGEGSTFIMELPRTPPRPEAS